MVKNKVEDIPIEEFENDNVEAVEEFLKQFPKDNSNNKKNEK